MNLYKISQTVNNDWDTYDSAVVAAPDEETARTMHPRGTEQVTPHTEWANSDWAEPKHVSVELIGEAKTETKQGIICASFNAG